MLPTTARPGPRLATLTLCAALLAACGGGGGATTAPVVTAAPGGAATGKPVTDLTALCDLLGPGDFASVGIAGAAAPTKNTDGPGSAYCTYAGKSAATGGIEFDIFVGDDAEGTFDTATGELAAGLAPATIPGVDEAVSTDGVAGKADSPAALAVRKGKVVFVLGAPGGTGASVKLGALAAIVLARAAGLVG